MASCSMGSSVAARIGLTAMQPNNRVSFRNTRLVVQAAEESPATPAATVDGDVPPAPAAKPKPPPIGPKRGSKVKILRKESYWYKGVGSVVAVDQVLISEDSSVGMELVSEEFHYKGYLK